MKPTGLLHCMAECNLMRKIGMWLYFKVMWLYSQVMWLYCQVMWLLPNHDTPNHMTVSLLTGALPCEKWGQISCCTSTTDHQPPHTINVCSPPQHEWPTSGNSDTFPSHMAKTAYSNSFCKGWVIKKDAFAYQLPDCFSCMRQHFHPPVTSV